MKLHDTAMGFIIGSGAILTSGNDASIVPATLHACVDDALAGAAAVAIDFEGVTPGGLSRLLIAAQSTNQSAFANCVSARLKALRSASLAQVLVCLARGTGCGEVHLFAHWLPDEDTWNQTRAAGVGIIAHPLHDIEAASVVSGLRNRRWRAA